MKKHVLAILVAAVAAASFALLAVRSEASASGSGDPRISVLQEQVRSLERQAAQVHVSKSGDPRIATLQKQVKTLQKEVALLDRVLGYNFDGDTCLAAITADLLQSTWIAVDQVTQKTTFGTQTQVNDYGTCERLANPAVPRTVPGSTAPSISPLLPMLQWLGG